MSETYTFGVSQYTTKQWSFEEDIENFPGLGVGAIEICEYKLDPNETRAQLALVREKGLPVTSVQPKVHTVYPDSLFKEPKEPKERMKLFRQAIEMIAPYIGAGTPFVANTGIAPNGNFREGWEVAVREMREIANVAQSFGMRIAMEPLNPVLMNENSFVWLIPQVMRMVEEVGADNFGVCVDLWNDFSDPRAAEHIRECGERIFVVQVSDWHRPRSFEDRAIVGRGEIDMPPLLRAIHEAGFRGAYTLEIFSGESLPDSLWRAPADWVIAQSREGFDRAWKNAFG